jgi:hypothetical protein
MVELAQTARRSCKIKFLPYQNLRIRSAKPARRPVLADPKSIWKSLPDGFAQFVSEGEQSYQRTAWPLFFREGSAPMRDMRKRPGLSRGADLLGRRDQRFFYTFLEWLATTAMLGGVVLLIFGGGHG